jgi:hypothetical protein
MAGLRARGQPLPKQQGISTSINFPDNSLLFENNRENNREIIFFAFLFVGSSSSRIYRSAFDGLATSPIRLPSELNPITA